MPFVYDINTKEEIEYKKMPVNVVGDVITSIEKDLNLNEAKFSNVFFHEGIIIVNIAGSNYRFAGKYIFDELGIKLHYSNQMGVYKITPLTSRDKVPGSGGYPYVINRLYNIEKHLDLFKFPDTPKVPKLGLEYTFGLEYETASGYIPGDLCFSNKIVPLRDGSIQGLEYTTGVMHMDVDHETIKRQAELLSKYTSFNKDCSMHIHFGGMTMSPTFLYVLYCVCKTYENWFECILPDLSYKTDQYKSSRKNYCQRLPTFNNFSDMYMKLSDNKTEFMGSLVQAHPSDPNKEGKWNIHSRYYWVNFVNACFFNNSKTIEFRILRPTFSSEMIINFVYLFGGLIKFAEYLYKNAGFSAINHSKLQYADVMKYLRTYRFENVLNALYGKDFIEELNKISAHKGYLKNVLLDNIGENYEAYKMFDMIAYSDIAKNNKNSLKTLKINKFELPKPKDPKAAKEVGDKFHYSKISAKQIMDDPELLEEFVAALDAMMEQED